MDQLLAQILFLFFQDTTNRLRILKAYAATIHEGNTELNALAKIYSETSLPSQDPMECADRLYWKMCDELHNNLPYDPSWYGDINKSILEKLIVDEEYGRILCGVMVATGQSARSVVDEAVKQAVEEYGNNSLESVVKVLRQKV